MVWGTMEPQNAELGALIREWRERAGITQEGMAAVGGPSPVWMSRLENASGTSRPLPRKIALVAKILDIPAGEIAGVVDDPEYLERINRELGHLSHGTISDHAAAGAELPTEHRTRVKPAQPKRPSLILLSPQGVPILCEVRADRSSFIQVSKQLNELLAGEGWVITSPI